MRRSTRRAFAAAALFTILASAGAIFTTQSTRAARAPSSPPLGAPPGIAGAPSLDVNTTCHADSVTPNIGDPDLDPHDAGNPITIDLSGSGFTDTCGGDDGDMILWRTGTTDTYANIWGYWNISAFSDSDITANDDTWVNFGSLTPSPGDQFDVGLYGTGTIDLVAGWTYEPEAPTYAPTSTPTPTPSPTATPTPYDDPDAQSISTLADDNLIGNLWIVGTLAILVGLGIKKRTR